MMETDVCVIGSGPAGYSAAITASQLGAKVVLVENEQLGGLCLNYGCIPTSTVLESVKMIRRSRKAESLGVRFGMVEVDPEAIIKRTEAVKDTLREGLRTLLRANNVVYQRGKASVTDRHLMEVKGEKGSIESIAFDRLIVATGSKPRRTFSSPRVVADQEAFVRGIPKGDTVVLGSSPIGLKLAYILNYLAGKVTVVEKAEHILAAFDGEISTGLRRSLTRQGIEFREKTDVKEVHEERDSVRVCPNSGDAINASLVITTEREAEISAVSALNLCMTEEGFIDVNEHLETSCDDVYAAGNVTGCSSASEAYMHGRVAAENATGRKSRKSPVIPRYVHVEPEAASVGITEEEARIRGLHTLVGRFPLPASGKAQAMGDSEGFVKLISDADTEELLGAHILGAGAVDLISIASVAMDLEATLQTLAHVVYPHPALSEAVKEAALHALGQPLHIPMTKRRSV